MIRGALLLAALVASAAGCGVAADLPVRVDPGSALFVVERITAGVDTLVIAAREGEEAFGVVLLETRLAGAGSGRTITRVERMRVAEGAVMVADSFVLDGGTLAPLSASPELGSGRERLEFEMGRVVHRERNGTVADVAVEEGSFYGNSLDVLLRALPLRPGFRATLPLYEPEARAAEDVVVRVEAEEDVRTAAGDTCPAWRVEVESREHGGTYWISIASHALLRYDAPGEPIHLVRLRGCG